MSRDSRKDSVYNALIQINSDYVVIHDGARPAIKEEYIKKSLMALENFKGVSTGFSSLISGRKQYCLTLFSFSVAIWT